MHNTNYVSKFAVWEEILGKKTTTKKQGKTRTIVSGQLEVPDPF